MPFLFVDCSCFSMQNCDRAKKGLIPGVVFDVKEQGFTEFGNAHDKLDYFRSEKFRNQISSVNGIYFDKKQNVVYLSNKIKKVQECVDFLQTQFPDSPTSWGPNPLFCVLLGPNDDPSVFVQANFAHPYLTDKMSISTNIHPSLCLVYDSENKSSTNETMDRIQAVMEGRTDGLCSIKISLSKQARKFLKDLCRKKNNKEYSGELAVVRVKSNGAYEIGIMQGSVQEGTDENVDVVGSLYSFHSHPEEAYVRHSVQKGWPSGTDYAGFAKLSDSTLLHFVSTLEGLYVLTLKDRRKKIPISDRSIRALASAYSIDHAEASTPKPLREASPKRVRKATEKFPLTPQGYVKRINTTRYKGQSWFRVYFFTWNKPVHVSIDFLPHGQACLVDQKQVELYARIHGTKPSRKKVRLNQE